MQDNIEDHKIEETKNSVGTRKEHTENKNSGEDLEQHLAKDKLKEEL
jgi:hypothetical protein